MLLNIWIKYEEGQFANMVKSHKSDQRNLNSTIDMALTVVEELNQTNGTVTQRRKAYIIQKQD